MEKQITDFLKDTDSDKRKITFPPMEKYERSIVHDVAEVAGLVAHSFGQEDVDRHLVVWKKEFSPCDAELDCLKRGIQDFDPETFAKTQAEEQRRAMEEEEEELKRKKEKFVPNKANYQEKYEHLIGR